MKEPQEFINEILTLIWEQRAAEARGILARAGAETPEEVARWYLFSRLLVGMLTPDEIETYLQPFGRAPGHAFRTALTAVARVTALSDPAATTTGDPVASAAPASRSANPQPDSPGIPSPSPDLPPASAMAALLAAMADVDPSTDGSPIAPEAAATEGMDGAPPLPLLTAAVAEPSIHDEGGTPPAPLATAAAEEPPPGEDTPPPDAPALAAAEEPPSDSDT
ncbi:MAG: hypothetical protein HQL66_14165, partial [Magnetococcales bacterium]|nr:hypothetical protein [Magnetococcales bacterium]